MGERVDGGRQAVTAMGRSIQPAVRWQPMPCLVSAYARIQEALWLHQSSARGRPGRQVDRDLRRAIGDGVV